jgi:flavin-dependent dehydrogenase
MSEPVLILGGGVAGLSAANRLIEQRIPVTLIEAGRYPQHKVCGEFISPEALPILRQWGLPIGCSIRQVILHARRSRLTYRFPSPAGSCSRFVLDHNLGQRAALLGCDIRTDTRVEDFEPGDGKSSPHRVRLSSGETLASHRLIISTGRVLAHGWKQDPPEFKYIGFKAHFKSKAGSERLEMHSFKDGYLGISPVDVNTVNAACLLKTEAFEKAGSPWAIIQRLQDAHPDSALLQQLQPKQMIFDDWLSTRSPALGIKHPPAWPRVYFVGDAMGSIYPATGSGLAMAVTSGCMAADFAGSKSNREYRQAWIQRYGARIRWGTYLHHLMMSPEIGQLALTLGKRIPRLDEQVFRKTRELRRVSR